MLSHWHNIATWATSPFASWREAKESSNCSPFRRPDLHTLWLGNRSSLPQFVQESAAAMKYLDLLGPLDWTNFPERDERKAWPGPTPAPRAPFVATFLIKLDKGLPSMPKTVEYLKENPGLVWLLGFPLVGSKEYSWGFDVDESLCTIKHFSRILRELDEKQLNFLFDGTVHLLRDALVGVELPSGGQLSKADFGDLISLDTKHIIAWVVENNPKERMSDRYIKTNQPKGDPDCKLGCKERKNQSKAAKTHDGSNNTPTQEGLPGSHKRPGEFYWGYGSGVVATKIPGWSEIVLAEMTQTFDKSDVSYFKPLMSRSEEVLGKSPSYGTLDAAFDAFYVYEYFHNNGGMAAVPLRAKGGLTFTADGLPLCKADIPFAYHRTYTKRSSTLYPHKRNKYRCPLLHPEKSADCCPVNHAQWPKGGCIADVPVSIGARIRVELDRESDEYKQAYKQRTATERVNSQAKALGIERPKLRNKHSIAHQNTLIYILINLRALQRVQAQKEKAAQQGRG